MPEKGYDFEFRPDYWSPAEALSAILTNVKGQLRRELIRDVVSGEAADSVREAGGDEQTQAFMSEVQPGLLADEMEDPRSLGRIHPQFLGGEFLSEYLPGEVEIARVVLQSTTMDVISVRARPAEDGSIRYRVVDEYETDFEVQTESSATPLSMAELITLSDSVEWSQDPWDWVGLTDSYRDFNLFGGVMSPEDLVGFVTVTSEFYPELERYYEEQAEEWCAERVEEQQEACEDCGELCDPHLDNHDCTQRRLRLEREKAERDRARTEREQYERPLLAPFLDSISALITAWETTHPASVGPFGGAARVSMRRALDVYVRDYVVKHSAMPSGRHTVRWTFMNDTAQTFEVDFEQLARN